MADARPIIAVRKLCATRRRGAGGARGEGLHAEAKDMLQVGRCREDADVAQRMPTHQQLTQQQPATAGAYHGRGVQGAGRGT